MTARLRQTYDVGVVSDNVHSKPIYCLIGDREGVLINTTRGLPP